MNSIQQHDIQQDDAGKNSPYKSLSRLIAANLWPAGAPGVKWRVVLTLLAILAAKMGTIYVPLLYKHVVDSFTAADEHSAVALGIALPLLLIGGYGVVRILVAILSQFRDAVFSPVGSRAVREISVAALQQLLALSPSYHVQRKTGAIVRSIERGGTAVQTLLSMALFNVAPTVIEVLMVTAVLWGVLSPVYSLITLLTVVIYVAFTMLVTEWRISLLRDKNRLDNRANSHAVDKLLNYETVKIFASENEEVQRYSRYADEYAEASVRSQKSIAYMNMGQGVIIALGVTVLMLLAGVDVLSGAISVGDFVMVNAFMLQLAQPVNGLGFIYRSLKKAMVDVENLLELFGERLEIRDAADAVPLLVKGGRVEFRQVSFGYLADRPVLRDISFTIPAGGSVAVVGATGSGKSTLGKLLLRFYDVQQGQILIDGQDVRAVTQHSLRSQISVVTQEPVLFNRSILYNIAYGSSEKSMAEVQKAAELADIHAFIMSLPEGYETVVGERGVKLSGGEKQRIAIARQFLRESPIMIFDEATSALDVETEARIQQNFRKVAQGRTTLVITHRLTTAVDADEILVIRHGQVVERGAHEQLLALGGYYARAWASRNKELEQSEAIN